ncbi:MAG: ROK family protein [archaeon]
MKIIGVDMGGTNVRAALVEDKKILKVESREISSKGKEDVIMGEVIGTIEKVFDDEVEGIGFGVPAIIDEKGVVYELANVDSWKKVEVKCKLEEKFKVPVVVNNDANCFALGEFYFGAGKGKQNFVGLIMGTGVGAGVIANGKLFSGQNFGAGEFGEVVYLDSKFENYCSSKYLEEIGGMKGEELFEKAKKGDKKTKKVFEEFGKHAGRLISVIVNTVDPELIVIGGSVSKSFKFFEKDMMKSAKDFMYGQSFKNLKIERAKLENSALLGVAALYLDSRK